MIKIEEQKQRILEVKKQIAETKSYYRKRDLRKHLYRLTKDLAEANKYINAH